MSMSRREWIEGAALVGVGVAAAGAMVAKDRFGGRPPDPKGPDTVRPLAVPIPARADEDPLLRMQRDLVRAMQKTAEERRWCMIIDTRKCVGCHACTIGCVAENKLPPGVVYRPVVTEERGEFPRVAIDFLPRPCMQCEKPPCVPVCPVKATWRRADGITVIDYDKCIGCRYCLTACPYGARTSDFGEYYVDAQAMDADSALPVLGPSALWEHAPSHEYGKHWNRRGHQSPMGNARKCHFCLHRLEVGQLPMCVTTCIGRATYFGDASDPNSLVAELVAQNNTQVLLPHKGTHPRVRYIF